MYIFKRKPFLYTFFAVVLIGFISLILVVNNAFAQNRVNRNRNVRLNTMNTRELPNKNSQNAVPDIGTNPIPKSGADTTNTDRVRPPSTAPTIGTNPGSGPGPNTNAGSGTGVNTGPGTGNSIAPIGNPGSTTTPGTGLNPSGGAGAGTPGTGAGSVGTGAGAPSAGGGATGVGR